MRAGHVWLRALLERPVTLKGIRLGVPVDAVLDSESLRVVGLEVLCSDELTRFLPLAAARIREDQVAVGSPLLLLEDDQREFYRRGSRAFRSLAGAAVVRDGRRLGELVDVLAEADGAVVAVSARASGSAVSVYERAEVTIDPAAEVSAA